LPPGRRRPRPRRPSRIEDRPPGRQPGSGAARSLDARLDEAIGLARAINLDVVGGEIVRLARPARAR
jgi:hypothetical protein